AQRHVRDCGCWMPRCHHVICCCFFFQAEDGIRDDLVTGVQTCALPISPGRRTKGMRRIVSLGRSCAMTRSRRGRCCMWAIHQRRSEERRVGKECRSRWTPEQPTRKDEPWARRRKCRGSQRWVCHGNEGM